MSLADYLAKNYLTADSEKKSKKRKRKNKDAGLIIDDDDDLGWKDKADEDNEDAPMIVGGGQVKKFKKKSKSTNAAIWTAVGVAAPSHAEQLAADAAVADAIIAGTAAEREKAAQAEDEAPEMVEADGVHRMESGAKAGLQTAAEITAAMEKKQNEEKRKAEEVAREMGSAAQQTIYRDASGRIINVAMKRAEARKKAEEEERKKAEKEKAARGDVQIAEAAKRKQKLEDAKMMTIARYADDAELNDELKERGHWNDPASGFLRKKKAGRSITGKPLYQGPYQPNRYGIRPGHRWDGVDRGNGFERQWFDSRNRKANNEKLEYQWQQDE
ncbi:similar to pre-mRNA-splicing factor cwc26 [Plenodomus lingam JN3]|uniref:Similar to pre-mRNA-splicing factor cwc26 n=1 Tax=Leptosphaeria maculans (strain JN3 / isolate v23.1.3 / race Av1-4-5-6-7-8) TaxID=985895 RepID=E5A805_LEPMJ|nr:similar to pre-mRNA-splicing factor cwc26 [Plenodomus lingam JN3]CBX99750.1 similar to pre-mRNA-splicing factor cwc26 [Plenodomus lingam JN3]